MPRTASTVAAMRAASSLAGMTAATGVALMSSASRARGLASGATRRQRSVTCRLSSPERARRSSAVRASVDAAATAYRLAKAASSSS